MLPEPASGLSLPAVWRPGEGPLTAALDGGLGGDAAPRRLRIWSAGFIANRGELLAASGLPPTATDRQLLAVLFRRLGTDCVRQIVGPFSWILDDPASGRLLAARDRAGACSLFHAQSGGQLLVAPRVGPLRRRLPSLALNRRSLVAQIHGCAPRPGETCFAGLQALEPGSILIASPRGIRIERYWRLEPGDALGPASDDEFAEALRELLFGVAAEYRPAEPCAVALSSGLDSTAVAAALGASRTGAPITLVTSGTPELPASDETAGATTVAAYLGLPLEVVRGDQLWPLSGDEGMRTLEEGPATTYREVWEAVFARLRQRGIRVMFTGASGDHLFGGTGVLVYPDLLLTGRWARLAAALRAHRDGTGESLPAIAYRRLLRPLVKAYLPRRWAVARRRVSWLAEGAGHLLDEVLPAEEGRWRQLPGRRLRLQALGDTMLAHGLSQWATLAGEHGIELRHPLVDHRLMEFAAALPLDQCLRAGVAKLVLRHSMRGHLPPSIVESRERIYPLALFERGLRHREQAKVRQLITGMRAAELGLVDEERLRTTYQRYLEGSGSTVFYHTLALEDWLRRYA